MRRRIIGIVGVLALLALAGGGAYYFSPWPSVLFIRHAFDKDAAARNEALEKHLPRGIVEFRDQRYGDGADDLLDVFIPAKLKDAGKAPAVVWIHGGAFIAGDKSDVASYLKILAGRGYVTVGIRYPLAPGARYPAPVIQANRALAFLASHADRFQIDPARIVLAGDSAGAQIAAQLAAGLADPAYAQAVGFAPAVAARQVKGIVLFCGVYDASKVGPRGPFGAFVTTAMWSYFGTKDFASDPRLAQFSVIRHLSPQFPRAFVSAGNADPLKPQSALIAEAIRAKGIGVDTLFFADSYTPPLPHEYQFNLDGDAGRQALERLSAFIARAVN